MRVRFVLLLILLFSPFEFALAKGRGVAMKGQIKNLQIELNSHKVEFLFSGIIEIKNEMGIKYNFKTEVKDFKLTFGDSLLWESDFCKDRVGKPIGDTGIDALPFTDPKKLESFLNCVVSKGEVYIEVPITGAFKLVLEGRELKAIQGNMYLFFRQAGKYPY